MWGQQASRPSPTLHSIIITPPVTNCRTESSHPPPYPDKDLLDFKLEWAENKLELMAKDMRTQPTSLNSIPRSTIFHFWSVCLRFSADFTCFDIKSLFLNFTRSIFNESRLYRRGLKSECVKIQSHFYSMEGKSQIRMYAFVDNQIWILGL